MLRNALLAIALGCVALSGAGCGPNRTRPDRPSLDGGTEPPLDCVPNLDGRIDAREIAPVLGVPVSYLVNPASEPRSVDLVGAIEGDARVWDLGSDYASDAILELAARPIEGQWFADRFAVDADFATALDAGATLLGVYRHGESALELLGIASTEESPPEGRTLLVYQTPIVVLRFPLEAGARWISTAEIRDGTIRGLPYAGRDTYDVAVIGEGTLVLPDLTVDRALRVATSVTIEPAAGESVSRRQSSFFFECLGEVARATSHDGETSDDFTVAAELRRLGI
ncbi:MAG: hypothetical protein M3Y87_00965 [Myxococcota bacterium]|nr:hypothetical protein [Myxococcota bacterium]